MIDIPQLKKIAEAMVARPKGLLASDESFGNIEKKFNALGIPVTAESRRSYREMLFTTPDIGSYISGAILFDETIRQNASDGRTFVEVLEDAGVMPGIKVDEGKKKIEGSEETITKGIEGLPPRLPEYVKLGAKFAKWRGVLWIGGGMPTPEAIRLNAKDLATYALLCQEAGLVPIVEPEVLMDGANDMETCRDATERTLTAVFEELARAGVATEGMILKPNMVMPGKLSGTKAAPEDVAEATVRLLKKILPPELPGVVFLSGGQSEVEATENLNAMSAFEPLPWKLTFSYGRALQESAMRIWAGHPANVLAAQEAFIHRSKMNSLATVGKYVGE